MTTARTLSAIHAELLASELEGLYIEAVFLEERGNVQIFSQVRLPLCGQHKELEKLMHQVAMYLEGQLEGEA